MYPKSKTKKFFSVLFYYYPEIMQQLSIVLFTLFVSTYSLNLAKYGWLNFLQKFGWLFFIGVIGLVSTWICASHHIKIRLPQEIIDIDESNAHNFFSRPFEDWINKVTSLFLGIGIIILFISLVCIANVAPQFRTKNNSQIHMKGNWNTKFRQTEIILSIQGEYELKDNIALLSSSTELTNKNITNIEFIPFNSLQFSQTQIVFVKVPPGVERMQYYALASINKGNFCIIAQTKKPIWEDTRAPAPPNKFSVRSLKHGKDYIKNVLSWNRCEAKDLKGYLIRRINSSNNQTELTVEILKNFTKHYDIIKKGIKYWYEICAMDACGNISEPVRILD